MTLAEFRADRAASKRTAILLAARDAFADGGLHAVSTATIARNAQVSTATLYRHFASKDDLFRAVIEHEIAAFGGADDAASTSDADPVMQVALAYAGLLVRPHVHGLIRSVIAEARAGDAMGQQLLAAGKAAVAQLFHQRLAAAVTPRRADDADWIAVATAQLQGMIEHHALLPALLLGHSPGLTAELRQAIAEAVTTWRARWAAP